MCKVKWWRTTISNSSETLPLEYLGGQPLCMSQYYQVLSSCRIPGTKSDTVVNYAQGRRPPSHITVVHNFQVSKHLPLLYFIFLHRLSVLNVCLWELMCVWSSLCHYYIVIIGVGHVDKLYILFLFFLLAVLCARCLQQWRHTTDCGSALYSAGEDLEFLSADKQGAHWHPYVTGPKHMGKSLQ